MGTDICPLVQHRVEERWVDVAHGLTKEDRCAHPIERRNYPLFAILSLANMSDAYGYAPVVPSRGLPHDFPIVLSKITEGIYHPFCSEHVGRTEREGSVQVIDGVRVVYNYDPEYEVPRCSKCIYMGRMYEAFNWVTLGELSGYDWPEELKDSAFVTEVIPWLETLGEPNDVRIVMGFD